MRQTSQGSARTICSSALEAVDDLYLHIVRISRKYIVGSVDRRGQKMKFLRHSWSGSARLGQTIDDTIDDEWEGKSLASYPAPL